MAFGDNLKKIRELRGKTAAQVYTSTGHSKGKYYAWEANEYEPGPEIVDSLAEFLNVPRELFYKKQVTEDDLNPKSRSFKDEIFEGEYVGVHQEIWQSYKQGVHHDREIMTTLANSLADAVRKLTGTPNPQ